MPYFEPIFLQFTGMIADPVNRDYTLDQYASFRYVVESMAAVTSAGTCTVALKIDGVAVTSISAVAVTTTETVVTATGANTVAIGNTLVLTASSVSAADNLAYTIKVRRI